MFDTQFCNQGFPIIWTAGGKTGHYFAFSHITLELFTNHIGRPRNRKLVWVDRYLPQRGINTDLVYGTAVDVGSGHVVEEASCRIDHHVAAGHQVITFPAPP